MSINEFFKTERIESEFCATPLERLERITWLANAVEFIAAAPDKAPAGTYDNQLDEIRHMISNIAWEIESETSAIRDAAIDEIIGAENKTA